MTGTKSGNRISILYLTASILTICFLLLFWHSPEFTKTNAYGDTYVLFFTFLLMFSALPYLAAVLWRTGTDCNKVIFFIFAAGLVFRIITIYSAPVLEVDFYRYMWDGAVTSSGINPYAYSPEEVIKENAQNVRLQELATDSGSIMKNINHKHLRTIYPPVTQFFFAISHIINPWSLVTWKLVLLVTDVINFLLLAAVLGKFKTSRSNTVIYWWNPLLVITTFNQAHFDIIPISFVLGALLLALDRRTIWSAICTAIAIGSKLWPLFIFPAITRDNLKSWKDYSLIGIFVTVPVFVIFIPVLISGMDSGSGFVAYGTSWENNSSAFTILLYLFQVLFEFAGIHPGHAQRYTRIFVLSIITLSVIWLFFRKKRRSDIPFNLLALTAMIFLVSPTQFPWYYTWVLPFTVLKPNLSLLLPTLLLPLYYTGYYFEPDQSIDIYRNAIIWLEFLPVWVMIVWEWGSGSFLKANE